MDCVNINRIPRRDLKPGAEYMGVGDGFNTARWDVGRDRFVSVRFNQGLWEIAHAPYGDGGFQPLSEVPVLTEFKRKKG